MHRKTLTVAALACVLVAIGPGRANAAWPNQTCISVKHQSGQAAGSDVTVNIIMQALGGVSSVAVLIVGEKMHWAVKAGAFAGLASTVWNMAKAYAEASQSTGDNNDTQVCISNPTEPDVPRTVTIGPRWGAFTSRHEFNQALQSPAGQRQWQDLMPSGQDALSRFADPDLVGKLITTHPAATAPQVGVGTGGGQQAGTGWQNMLLNDPSLREIYLHQRLAIVKPLPLSPDK